MLKRPEVFHLFPELEKRYAMSRAWKVGDIIYLSGFTAFDERGNIVGPGDMGAQFRQIYKNMARTLAHFGVDLHHVIEQYVFVTDIDRVEEGIAVVRELWDGHEPPVAVGVEVKRLALPEMLVEIKATAYG